MPKIHFRTFVPHLLCIMSIPPFSSPFCRWSVSLPPLHKWMYMWKKSAARALRKNPRGSSYCLAVIWKVSARAFQEQGSLNIEKKSPNQRLCRTSGFCQRKSFFSFIFSPFFRIFFFKLKKKRSSSQHGDDFRGARASQVTIVPNDERVVPLSNYRNTKERQERRCIVAILYSLLFKYFMDSHTCENL